MTVTSVAEGGMAYVWVEVTNTTRDAVSDDEEFTISLMAADQNQLLDYRVSPASFKTEARGGFTSSGDDTEMVGPFTLEALADEDIGEEELMLNVNLTGQSTTYGAGESNGMFSITIEDTTQRLVWAKSDEEIQEAVYAAKGEGPMSPGDSFEVMTGDLFMMADGVTVAFSATSDGAAASASASASIGEGHGRRGRNGPCYGHCHRKHGVGCQGAPADHVECCSGCVSGDGGALGSGGGSGSRSHGDHGGRIDDNHSDGEPGGHRGHDHRPGCHLQQWR